MMTSVSTLSLYLNTVPFAFFIDYTSLGSVIYPVNALAAAVYGLAK